jgi:ankyrin repeat protein
MIVCSDTNTRDVIISNLKLAQRGHYFVFNEKVISPAFFCVLFSNTKEVADYLLTILDTIDINKLSENEMSMLMYSCQYSHTISSINTVDLLIRHKADCNQQGINGYTALMFAAICTNTTSGISTVEFLVDNGADCNIKNYKGSSALSLVCTKLMFGSTVDTIRCLIERKADINTTCCLGNTPTMTLLSSNGRSDAVSILLDYKADVSICNKQGSTALMLASMYSNELDHTILDKLLESKSELDAQNKLGYTALMYASRYSGTTSSPDTVKFLLSRKADINLTDVYNRNSLLLSLSTKTSTYDTTRILLEYKSDINGVSDSSTALHIASTILTHNENDILRYLIRNTKDINKKDGNENTALLQYIKNCHYPNKSILELFTDMKADITLCNNDNMSCLHYLVSKNSYDPDVILSFSMLVDIPTKNKKDTPIIYMLKYNRNQSIVSKIFNILIPYIKNVNHYDSSFNTALGYTLTKEAYVPDIILKLLHKGAKVISTMFCETKYVSLLYNHYNESDKYNLTAAMMGFESYQIYVREMQSELLTKINLCKLFRQSNLFTH